MKKRKGDDWFPFWIDKWIFGSTRDELTVEQCAVWVDFLALSYKDEGYIRANEGIPYPIKRLAGLLNRSEELIQQTIDRCLDPNVKKLRRDPDGTLYVLSHPQYELSNRHKRRLSEDDVRQKGHGVQKKDAKRREEKNRIDKNRIDKKKVEAAKAIYFDFEEVKWINIKDKDLIFWKMIYPACNIESELNKMADWLLSNPDKKKIRYRRFISGWLSRTQDRGGSKTASTDEINAWAEKQAKKEKK